MFAYCGNLPVLYSDSEGTRRVSVLEKSGYKYSEKEQKIVENKETIKKSAKKHNVDPRVVAGCIYVEQTRNYNILDKVTDVPLSFLDTSVGLGQVKVSTARTLEESGIIDSVGKRSTNYDYAKKLQSDNVYNIDCVAAYLSVHQDQWCDVYDVSGDPAILGTLYNIGSRTPHVNPKPSPFGQKVAQCYLHMEFLLK